MTRAWSRIRELFSSPAGGETVRAFLVGGVLLAVLAAAGVELASRGMRVQVLRERIGIGREEAQQIARDVVRLGRHEGSIDYGRLRDHRDRLAELIQSRIARRHFIRHVEVRDRFGARLVYVAGELAEVAGGPTAAPGAWPPLDEEIIHVPLTARRSLQEGEVRLGISQQVLQRELEELERSLRIKLALAGGLALAVLVLGLFYVLHLIRKNRMLEQARQSAARTQYVGLLASNLAHEIRNPLNSMNMNLQMLEEELEARRETDPDHLELLEATKGQIKRLEQLVNNFLAYARPVPPRFDSRDLNQVVRDVMRLLEVDFRQSGVYLSADLEPLLPPVEIDETQLNQALINLLVNARQVLGKGGHVVVRTRAGSGGEAVVEVADDGPGVPVEARERIFEVFYSSRGGGTGLGLPIARQIVERHGGTIEMDTEEGRGTTFRIRLPRRQRQPAIRPEPTGAAR